MVAPPPSTPRENGQVFVIDGYHLPIAREEHLPDLTGLGVRRAWEVEIVPRQDADPGVEFTLPMRTFHHGSGVSVAPAEGFYESVDGIDGWDATAPGKLSTWPRLTTLEAFTTVDSRGWGVYHGGYYYALRGRYCAKYAVDDAIDDEWPVVEFHNFGTDIEVVLPPAIYEGDLYVGLQDNTGTDQRFHRLSTVAITVTETQTIVVSGSPSAGTYTISFNDGVATYTTAALAYNADGAAVQAALRLLPGLSKVTVVTTGTTPNFTHTVTLTAAQSALAASSPPQFTSTLDGTMSGSGGSIAHATTVAGTGDRWDRGPVAAEAFGFVVKDFALVRAHTTNLVSFNAGDPLTAGDWGPNYEVGDSTRAITGLAVLNDLLCIAKTDGLWTAGPDAKFRHEPLGIEDVIDGSNGIGMRTVNAAILMPHRLGLLRWRPGSYLFVGPEADDLLEGQVAEGWGRVSGIAHHGRTIYTARNDSYHTKGVMESLRLGGERAGGLTPHMHAKFASAAQDITVVSLASQPATPLAFATFSSDSAVGTVAWTSPSNAVTADSVFATAGAGTSEYLKAVNPGQVIPSEATIDGIALYVTRKRQGTLPVVGAAGTTVTSGPGAPPTIAVTAPSSASGVFMMAVITVDSGGTGSLPSGWTQLISIAGTTVAYKVAGGAEAGTYTFTGTAFNNQLTGYIISITGLDATTPVSVTGSTGNGTSPTAPSVTTLNANEIVLDFLAFTGTLGTYGSGSITTAGFTSVAFGAATGGGNISVCQIASKQMTDAGASGDSTSSTTGSGPWVHQMVSLLPAVVPDVVDNVVKLVKSGSVVGDNKADTVTQWPLSNTQVIYGGATDKWGTTWTAAEVSDTTTGAVLSATVGDGEAAVDEITRAVWYTIGGGDPASYLVVQRLDADRTSLSAYVYKLPRSGLTVANDPNIDKRTANGAALYTARFSPKGRTVQSVYRSFEAWVEASPETNTPGLKVWGSIDGAAEVQLQTDAEASSPAGAVIRTTGRHEVFFPVATNDGHHLQIHLDVPAVSGAEDRASYVVRDAVVRGDYFPSATELINVSVTLQGQIMMDDGAQELRTAEAVRSWLEQLQAPVDGSARHAPYRDPYGQSGYLRVVRARFRDMKVRPGDAPAWYAVLTVRRAHYNTSEGV